MKKEWVDSEENCCCLLRKSCCYWWRKSLLEVFWQKSSIRFFLSDIHDKNCIILILHFSLLSNQKHWLRKKLKFIRYKLSDEQWMMIEWRRSDWDKNDVNKFNLSFTIKSDLSFSVKQQSLIIADFLTEES